MSPPPNHLKNSLLLFIYKTLGRALARPNKKNIQKPAAGAPGGILGPGLVLPTRTSGPILNSFLEHLRSSDE